jgi:5-bromo-4-chloroindolyl phosphate hydrolysis protein
MEKIQDYFYSRFESMIPKKWAESHAHPFEVPKRKIDIQREIEEVRLIT